MKPLRLFVRRKRRRFRLFRRPRRPAGRRFAMLMIRQLPNLLKLVVRVVRDARVSLPTKALFAAVAVYVLAPFDLIPDVLGPLGLVDDVYLVGLALHRLMAAAGADILLEHWDGDPAELGYLVGGVEDVGGILPARMRRVLRRLVARSGA
jgi:uncharacterized membrane protein YkvA (DUF1232 family)